MLKIDGIPGTFINPVTKKIRFIPGGEYRDGEVVAQRYSVEVFDGVLGLLVSRDPAGPGGELLWHISMSHRHGWKNNGEEVITRLPTWDELKLAKYRLIPADVVMAILLPAIGQFYVDDHPTCLHMWEVPRHLAD